MPESTIVRGELEASSEGETRLVDGSGRTDETLEGTEVVERYGHAARPNAGSRLWFAVEGNRAYCIGSDGEGRPELAEGDSTLYNDDGVKVLLHEKTLESTGADSYKLTTNAGAELALDGKTFEATGADSYKLTTNAGAVLFLDGTTLKITGVTAIELGNGTLRKLIDERVIELYNQHTHNVSGIMSGPSSTNSAAPGTQLTEAGCATTITRAV